MTAALLCKRGILQQSEERSNWSHNMHVHCPPDCTVKANCGLHIKTEKNELFKFRQ